MPKVNINQSEISNDQVIDQFISNENNVLQKIYRHNFKIVRSYILKNNGTDADAKDIFQEVVMIAWLNMKEGKFIAKNEFSLSAYIYKISKYKWLDKLKSKSVKSSKRIGEVDYTDLDGDADEYAEVEERLNYLNGLYDKLDSKCKDVLNQFYYERKNLEEIATALKYDIGSIRTIKYRCMQKLRKMHANSQTQIDL